MIDLATLQDPQIRSMLAEQLAAAAPPPVLGTGLAPSAGINPTQFPGSPWSQMMSPAPAPDPGLGVLPPGVGAMPNPFLMYNSGLMPGEQAGIPQQPAAAAPANAPGLNTEQAALLAKMGRVQPETPHYAPAVSPHNPGQLKDMSPIAGGNSPATHPSLAQLLYGRR